MHLCLHPPTQDTTAFGREGMRQWLSCLLQRDVHATPKNFHVWATQDYPAKLEHESIRAKKDVRPILEKADDPSRFDLRCPSKSLHDFGDLIPEMLCISRDEAKRISGGH